jgi:steroid 5-alpha reductase family enzyme
VGVRHSTGGGAQHIRAVFDLALLLLFRKWEPIGGVVWSVDNLYGRGVITALYAMGWLVVLISTFQINHFDLFGLRQVWFYLKGEPYQPLKFGTPGLYKLVRHPLYVGWLMVFWPAPVMTVAHLVFALMATAYILVAIQFEERDLMRLHREYVECKKNVPMLIPVGRSKETVKAGVDSVR